MYCNKLADCINCSSYGGDMFYYLRLISDYKQQIYLFKQNCILFSLKGKIKIQGLHFPDIILAGQQFIIIPVAEEISITILEDCDCLIYRFDELPILCEKQYEKIIHSDICAENGHILEMLPPLINFTQSIINNLNDGMLCRKFLEIKQEELIFLINNYYSQPELLIFLSLILKGLNHFRSFVLKNYYKVKTIEELAILGRYSLITFRRQFRKEFGEPAYQWILRQKKEHILYDLTHRNYTISEISEKYLFESLPQFSNFCKKHFNASPREIQLKKSTED